LESLNSCSEIFSYGSKMNFTLNNVTFF
jgi:hypothetical protein